MKSIKNKILMFAILATLVPSLGVGLLSFGRSQDLISENASLELRTLARHSSSELMLWFRERVNEVRALSTSNAVIDGLSAPVPSRPDARRTGPQELALYLRSVQKRLDPLLELTVCDAAGKVVASSVATATPVALPAAWSSAAVTEGLVPELPRWDVARGTATLTLLMPILSPRNEYLGALAALLDLGTVKPRLREVAQSSPAEVIVSAPNGTPLLGTSATTTDLAPLDAQWLQRLRAHPGEALTFDGHHRRPVLGLAEVPGSLPFVVVAERDRDEIYQAWLESLKLFLALIGGLTLLVGLIAYLIGRSIVRPLDALVDATDRIASGDLGVELRVAAGGEIGHLTRVFNTMTDRLRRSRTEVEAASATLQKQNELLAVLSVTDSLTGVFNRKKLDDVLIDQFARSRRSHRPFCVLMLDIDNFKALNDTYGHLAGDEVLANLAAILKRSVRAIDFVARYGGEEFVIVLVETTLDAGLEIAERIRSVVETPRLVATNDLISVTVSLGVTQSRPNDGHPQDVLARADRAMYEAKRAGRNRVRAT